MKKKGMHAFLVTALLFCLFLKFIPTMSDFQMTDSGAEQEQDVMKLESSKKLYESAVDHDPFSIVGNQEFYDFVDAESLDGSGTENEPYIIDGFVIEISARSSHLWRCFNFRLLEIGPAQPVMRDSHQVIKIQ